MTPDQSAAKEANPSRLKLAPSAIIVVEELATERLGSLPRDPDSLAMVMIDEPTAERLISPRVLTTGFGERHQKRLDETIELNNTSALVEYSEGVQPKAIREDPSGSTLVPDDDSPSEVPFVEEEAVLAPRKNPTIEIRQRGILPMKFSTSPFALPAVRRWRRC